MTMLPENPSAKKLGLVIDLDICVGCHACVVNCKEWNTGSEGAPLSDINAYGAEQTGSWLNRIHTFEVTTEKTAQVVHFRSLACIARMPLVSLCVRRVLPTSALKTGLCW